MQSWDAMEQREEKGQENQRYKQMLLPWKPKSLLEQQRQDPRSLDGKAGWHLGDWLFVLSSGYLECSLRKAECVLITHFVFPNRREEREGPHWSGWSIPRRLLWMPRGSHPSAAAQSRWSQRGDMALLSNILAAYSFVSGSCLVCSGLGQGWSLGLRPGHMQKRNAMQS